MPLQADTSVSMVAALFGAIGGFVFLCRFVWSAIKQATEPNGKTHKQIFGINLTPDTIALSGILVCIMTVLMSIIWHEAGTLAYEHKSDARIAKLENQEKDSEATLSTRGPIVAQLQEFRSEYHQHKAIIDSAAQCAAQSEKDALENRKIQLSILHIDADMLKCVKYLAEYDKVHAPRATR
jgi:hypothetical protein